MNRIETELSLSHLAYAPARGSLICSGGTGNVHHVDVPTQDVTCIHQETEGSVMSLATSARAIAAGFEDGRILVWDSDEHQPIGEHHLETPVRALNIAQNDVVAGTDDGTVSFWDVTSDDAIRHDAHADLIVALACSPDQNHLITGGIGPELHLWDLEAQERTRELPAHETAVVAVGFLSNEKAISIGYEGAINLWDVETGAGLWETASPDTGEHHLCTRQETEDCIVASEQTIQHLAPEADIQTRLRAAPKTGVKGMTYSPIEDTVFLLTFANEILAFDVATEVAAES